MKIMRNDSHFKYARRSSVNILAEFGQSTRTGIASVPWIHSRRELHNGNAIIALDGDKFAGFVILRCGGMKNCSPTQALCTSWITEIRLAQAIQKRKIWSFQSKFPQCQNIGNLPTGLAVMKMNYELGYKPGLHFRSWLKTGILERLSDCVKISISLPGQNKNVTLYREFTTRNQTKEIKIEPKENWIQGVSAIKV